MRVHKGEVAKEQCFSEELAKYRAFEERIDQMIQQQNAQIDLIKSKVE